MAPFDAGLQGLQAHALLADRGMDGGYLGVAQLRQEDGQGSSEAHHCQIETGTGARPLVYLKHPVTK
jgi:hypothetical protein